MVVEVSGARYNRGRFPQERTPITVVQGIQREVPWEPHIVTHKIVPMFCTV